AAAKKATPAKKAAAKKATPAKKAPAAKPAAKVEQAPQASATPTASIVIPVYNEEALLTSAINDLVVNLGDRLPDLNYEIIITENGSVDDTLELAYKLERKYDVVRTLHSPEPNYGRALRRGILAARGTWVLCDEIDICDVDFQSRALEILTADQADMVVGSKAHRDAQDQRPVMRRTATMVLNGMLRVALGFRGTDTHG
ncbi:MAG: glycosyltransferase family 2 protein, partial [Myxococcota bacterium]